MSTNTDEAAAKGALLIPALTALGRTEGGIQPLALLALRALSATARLSPTALPGSSARAPAPRLQFTAKLADIKELLNLSLPFSASSPDSQYWIYDGERRVSGPTPIVELGLPASPVQAALVWGAEKNKIYIFSGGNYWRFNPHTRQVDNIYPRTMADWRGVPQEIDAAFQDEFGQCQQGQGLLRAGRSA